MKKILACLLAAVLLCGGALAAPGNAAGDWEGEMYGLAVALMLNEDGTYTLTLSDYPGSEPTTGAWLSIGNNVIMDRGTESEAVFVLSGDALASADGTASFTRRQGSSDSGKSTLSAQQKKPSLSDFAGAWDAETIEYAGSTLDAEAFGLDMRLVVAGTSVTVSSVSMEIEEETVDFTYTASHTLEYSESDGTTEMFMSLAFEDESEPGKMTMLMVVDGEELCFYMKPAEESQPEAAPTRQAAFYPTMQRGSKGDNVAALQKRLIELGYLEGSADGDFGKKTQAAVERFQGAAGLPVTGMADRDTQVALYDQYAPLSLVYLDLDFDAMSRDPDRYAGGEYQFTGKVLQTLEDADQGGTLVNLRVATRGNYDDVVLVVYVRKSGESRVLEGDRVAVYGQYGGLYSYESVMGSTITVPYFDADIVSVQ